ncbi:hypothetical protein ACP70R_028373 [Stipagrostis hirtigluma subsp. patula]
MPEEVSNKRRGSPISPARKQKALRSNGKTDRDIQAPRIHKRRRWRSNDPFQEEFASFSDSSEGDWSKLSKKVVSNLSHSVVQLASSIEGKVRSVCTGMIVANNLGGTTILTSGSLVRTLDDNNRIDPYLRITALLPNKEKTWAVLKTYISQYNVALVYIGHVPGIRAEARLGSHLQSEYCDKVVAVGRCINSGKLLAAAGTLTHETSGDHGELMISTCKITESGIGGPLVDIYGNFVGMNMYANEKSLFLPRSKIHECLGLLWDIIERANGNPVESKIQMQKSLTRIRRGVEGSSSRKGRSKSQKPSRSSEHESKGYIEYVLSDDEIKKLPHFRPLSADDEFTAYLIANLNSRGYPLPITVEGGMHLVNSFEDKFDADILSKLTKRVAFNASQSVVSLASFRGETRYFACTGFLIGSHKSTARVLTSASLVRDANMIVHDLKIEVCLPDNQHKEGTLECYCLQYNIALVSIKDFHCIRTVKVSNLVQVKPRMKVVAIGRVFQTGKLMATGGIVTRTKSNLDCKDLMISTCKTSKAGIGGPLLDFDGNFVGMNFYATGETPFLPGNIVLKLLRHFDGQRTEDGAAVQSPNPNNGLCLSHVGIILRVSPVCIIRAGESSESVLALSLEDYKYLT